MDLRACLPLGQVGSLLKSKQEGKGLKVPRLPGVSRSVANVNVQFTTQECVSVQVWDPARKNVSFIKMLDLSISVPSSIEFGPEFRFPVQLVLPFETATSWLS